VTIAPGSISYRTGGDNSRSRACAKTVPRLDDRRRYKVEPCSVKAAMGVVYRCVHTIIGKKVAMKVLRADLARDAEVTERFLNEAKPRPRSATRTSSI